MYKKIVWVMILCTFVFITACNSRSNENNSTSQNSMSIAADDSSKEIIAEDEIDEMKKPDINYVKTELVVKKIAPSHEAVLEEVAFSLDIPENMTVTYKWGDTDTDIPTVMGEDDWYIQTSSMSASFDESRIKDVVELEGGRIEELEINDYTVILTTVPSEKYSAIELGKIISDGFNYTYYIVFDDNYVLPLTFFSETESEDAKQEFTAIVSTFELTKGN